jgi:hypothetical protein
MDMQSAFRVMEEAAMAAKGWSEVRSEATAGRGREVLHVRA